ncbi:hypothetical protein C9439_08020 [archaeon SCG-AAA382B04]|nr:hypothetical protein C9439_08020 [archaeon SCG-AAA382B04]
MGDKETFVDEAKEVEIKTEEGKEFLNKYDEPTKSEYENRLKKYLAYRGKNCKELIDEAEKDWREGKRDREFLSEKHINKLGKQMKEMDYSSNYIANILTTLQAFYKFHQFSLNSDRLKRIERINNSQTKRIEKKEVIQLYNTTTSKRNKAILLFLYQTGQAAQQVVELNYRDVKQELEEDKVPLMLEYSGRKGHGNDYVTFLGNDGVEALKQYIEKKEKKLGRQIRRDEPLFSSKKDLTKRITSPAISNLLSYLAKESGLVTEEELSNQRNPYMPHAFRKNFKSQLATRASNFVIEYMMGHELGVEKDYFLADHDGKEGLREYYAENMEPHLSIQTTTLKNKAVISKEYPEAKKEEIKKITEKRIEEEREKWKDKFVNEKIEREELEDKIKDLEKHVKKQSELLEKTLKIDTSKGIPEDAKKGIPLLKEMFSLVEKNPELAKLQDSLGDIQFKIAKSQDTKKDVIENSTKTPRKSKLLKKIEKMEKRLSKLEDSKNKDEEKIS